MSDPASSDPTPEVPGTGTPAPAAADPGAAAPEVPGTASAAPEVPGTESAAPETVLAETVLAEAPALSAEIRSLLETITAADGIAPLSDGLLAAAADSPWAMRTLHAGDDGPLIGFGIAAAQGERGALEAAIAPDHRGRGAGSVLIAALLQAAGHPVWMWSHGDHPAAARIAAAHGFTRARELLQLSTGPVAELDLPDRPAPAGVSLRSFAAGDEEGWLAVNNAAFDWHPEQGSQTRADIDAIVSAPDFDPASVIIATTAADPADTSGAAGTGTGTDRTDSRQAAGTSGAALDAQGRRIIGFHQTKLHADHPSGLRVGEVYVVAADPHVHARGIGQALTVEGMRRLIAAGAERIELYVESDNDPARRLYARLGFDRQIVHVSYAPPGAADV